jgi:Ca-activated chloride channel family protein
MMKAIKTALDPSDDQSHVRIVCFMTDGYVGNDMEIISEIQKHPNARVFSFGIGSSVNRFLLDKMAEAGRGEVEYVGLKDDGSAAAKRFHERVRDPLLTDIAIEWNNLPVADVYPQRIPDLFSAKPLVIKGRFTAAGRGSIRLKGKMAGVDFVRDIPVEFPETMASHDVLAPLWARARIDDLMNQDFNGAQSGTMRPDLKKTITQLGIEYRLMTQFTSFVAVEERVVTERGQPKRIDVPVEVPKGVNRMMVEAEPATRQYLGFTLNTASAAKTVARGAGGGGGGRSRTPPPPNTAPMVSSVSAGLSNVDAISTGQPEPPGQQSNELAEKLHRAVFSIVEKSKNKQALSSEESALIRDGKVDVQVWLTAKTDEAMAQLKELGFEVVSDAKNSKIVIGRLPVEKLEALAKFKFVKYVAPQR